MNGPKLRKYGVSSVMGDARITVVLVSALHVWILCLDPQSYPESLSDPNNQRRVMFSKGPPNNSQAVCPRC